MHTLLLLLYIRYTIHQFLLIICLVILAAFDPKIFLQWKHNLKTTHCKELLFLQCFYRSASIIFKLLSCSFLLNNPFLQVNSVQFGFVWVSALLVCQLIVGPFWFYSPCSEVFSIIIFIVYKFPSQTLGNSTLIEIIYIYPKRKTYRL